MSLCDWKLNINSSFQNFEGEIQKERSACGPTQMIGTDRWTIEI
jgi:hypothetical protein